MSVPAGRREWRRTVSGGTITLLGMALLGIPLYDIWDDYSVLSWTLLSTVAENATFLLLALGIAVGGVWLVRSDWETRHVSLVAKWTVGGWLAATALFAWVVFVQLQVMGALKPYVIAMDGVLIGTAVTFGLGLVSAKTDITRSELSAAQRATAAFEEVHRAATTLQRVQTPAEAHEAVLRAVESLYSPAASRVVVDGQVVAARPDEADWGTSEPSLVGSVGDRGRIELVSGECTVYDEQTLELLGTHLDGALDRIDREEALSTERKQFALLNRTLRHDLTNDIHLVQARLDIIDPRIDPPEEHWSVVRDRVDEMEQFIQQMGEYMRLAEADGHDPEPIELRPTIEQSVATVQQAHEDAEVSLDEIPDVTVDADELLDSVFDNLVRNAVEHNDKATPKVRVSGTRQDGTVTIDVADNGPGIPDDQKERIRERGEQLDDASGTGLGLHLVTEAVAAYDGDLAIEDNDPTGTVFRVTLPVAA